MVDIIVGMLRHFYFVSGSGSRSVSLLPSSALDRCMRIVEFLQLSAPQSDENVRVKALQRDLLALHSAMCFLPLVRSRGAASAEVRIIGSGQATKRKWSAASMLGV